MFRAGNGTAFTVEAMLGSGPITFGSVAMGAAVMAMRPGDDSDDGN